MGHQERMNRIEDHFKSVSVNEVETNLIKAGIERIPPASRFNMAMLSEEDLKSGFRYESTKTQSYKLGEEYQTFILSPASLRPEDAA